MVDIVKTQLLSDDANRRRDFFVVHTSDVERIQELLDRVDFAGSPEQVAAGMVNAFDRAGRGHHGSYLVQFAQALARVVLDCDDQAFLNALVASIIAPRNGFPALRKYLEAMVAVPAGAFLMGSDRNAAERPIHRVTLSAFRMGRTPVTVAMWKEYCAATDTQMPGAPPWGWIDDHPIVGVTWNGIAADGGFCTWASGVAGVPLWLPTEAQWEYAARGPDNLEYPWGRKWDETKCVYAKTSNSRTAPVGSISEGASWCGCLDLMGNVWEWCSDRFDAGYYETLAANGPDPIGPNEGEGRIARGGSWYSIKSLEVFRCAYRGQAKPSTCKNSFGFRIVEKPR